MTDCPNGDVRDALPDYLNDRLDSERRREVESHLAGCAACRAELSLLRTLRATVQHAPAVDVEAIAASIPRYRAPVRRTWATSGRVAAAIVAIAVGGTSIVLLRGRTPVTPVEGSRPVAVAVAPSPDSTTLVPAPASVEAPAAERVTPAPTVGFSAPVRELAIAGGSIADLSDRELSALVEGIESLDGVPSAEVETPEPVSMSAQEGI
jgi:anti-sigma factor RsiW